MEKGRGISLLDFILSPCQYVHMSTKNKSFDFNVDKNLMVSKGLVEVMF